MKKLLLLMSVLMIVVSCGNYSDKGILRETAEAQADHVEFNGIFTFNSFYNGSYAHIYRYLDYNLAYSSGSTKAKSDREVEEIQAFFINIHETNDGKTAFVNLDNNLYPQIEGRFYSDKEQDVPDNCFIVVYKTNDQRIAFLFLSNDKQPKQLGKFYINLEDHKIVHGNII